MKNFLSLFKRSAQSLKELRTLATTGMLLAAAVALHFFGIQVTADLRITFTFIPICIIAMLYGPVVCSMATFSLDIIGFILDNRTARGYSPQLSLVVILSGLLYGIFLYREEIKGSFIAMIILAKTSVNLICNIILNSYFIYTLYVNKSFSIFTPGSNNWSQFWVWITPRIIKNGILLPIEITVLAIVLPLAMKAYKSIKKTAQ